MVWKISGLTNHLKAGMRRRRLLIVFAQKSSTPTFTPSFGLCANLFQMPVRTGRAISATFDCDIYNLHALFGTIFSSWPAAASNT